MTFAPDLFNEDSYLLGVIRTIAATASSTGVRVSELAEIAKSAIAHVENNKREARMTAVAETRRTEGAGLSPPAVFSDPAPSSVEER